MQRSQVARAWQAGAQHRVARQAQVQGSRWGKKARQDRSAVLGKACAAQGGMAGAGVGPNSPFQSECRRNGSRDQGADGHTSRKLFWRVYTQYGGDHSHTTRGGEVLILLVRCGTHVQLRQDKWPWVAARVVVVHWG